MKNTINVKVESADVFKSIRTKPLGIDPFSTIKKNLREEESDGTPVNARLQAKMNISFRSSSGFMKQTT